MPHPMIAHLIIAGLISISVGNGITIAQTAAGIQPPRDETQWQKLPRVVMGEEQKRLLVAHDHIYVKGLYTPAAEKYSVLRPGAPLTGTDADSDQALQHGSIYLGRARLVHSGDPAVMVIEQSEREIRPGDYLVALPSGGISDDE